MNLMSGYANGTFKPVGTISIAETIVMLSRIHSTYCGNDLTIEAASPWYKPYVDYCAEHNLIKPAILEFISDMII